MNRIIKVIKLWTKDFENFEKADLSGEYNDIWIDIDDLTVDSGCSDKERVEAIKSILEKKDIELLKSGKIDNIIIAYDR